LGTVSIEYKKFGTQVDFVPIVLGNGNVRLEVRPRISEIDPTRSITINGTTVPGLRVREADTGVEMKPGQTLAIAGLVQTRLETQRQEIPWLGDLPYLGVAFRNTFQTEEEIESLILVTPEVVQALDPCEVPQCYPGMHSDVPNDCQLYLKGYNEVPSHGPCGPYGCAPPCGYGDLREGPGYGPEGAPLVGPTPAGVPPAEIYEAVPPGSPTSARPMPSGNSPPPSTPPSADNRYNPSTGQGPRSASESNRSGAAPGFIGPVGYDVLN
jgi:pilus assembly protein CpaC